MLISDFALVIQGFTCLWHCKRNFPVNGEMLRVSNCLVKVFVIVFKWFKGRLPLRDVPRDAV